MNGTASKPPEVAVEAAVKEVVITGARDTEQIIRAALTAAAPYMIAAEVERIAQAIEAMSIVDRLTKDGVRRLEPKQVRAIAARIARNEGDPA